MRLFSLFLFLMVFSTPLRAAQEIDIVVDDQDISLSRYEAEGERLMIWLMPRLSATPRVKDMAERVADRGIEVWLVDLAESLFLPAGPASLRQIQGEYVAGLISRIHERSNKSITLMARGYASIPALKGARHWQASRPTDSPGYLAGVVLLSPDLHATIPSLGREPVYEPITGASNLPIMLYQSGKRGNRWQLDVLLEQLQAGGARTFHKILPGVTGLFNDEDTSGATVEALKTFPAELDRATTLLQRIPTPVSVASLDEEQPPAGLGLDIQLTPFSADLSPVPLDLRNVQGQRVVRKAYRGKVTVMNFWASWCPPCVEEIPSLNNLRKAMADQPFELISINYAEDRERIRQFLREVKVDFPVLLDPDGRYSAQWNVLVFPATFVIGPDGEIVYGVNGAIHWDSEQVISRLKALLP